MSLILDALSRAEREKREQANPAPSILSQAQASPVPEESARSSVVLGSVAVTILVLVLTSLLYFLYEDTPLPLVSDKAVPSVDQHDQQAQRKPPAQTTSAVAEAQGTPLEQRRPLPRPSAASARDMDLASDIANDQSVDAVAALYAMPSEDRLETRSQALESAAKEAESTADRIAAEQSAAEELVDIERVLRELRAKANPETLVPHPAPLLEDLTKQFRDRVPTLMYSAHDFNSAGRSSVVINGQALTLRQRSRGVEVREILADSVILRFEGTDFRLKSLNSWVNL